GEEGDRHFLVMEYLEGVTLSCVLRKRSPEFKLAMQLRILSEVLEGLHYAHTLRDFNGKPLAIVHRDVTPQNVFLTYDGQVKLLDFGVAKAIDTNLETRAGFMKGKPSYMAPEQLNGVVDPRIDVYAAGVILWEAISGRKMWLGRSEIEILSCI